MTSDESTARGTQIPIERKLLRVLCDYSIPSELRDAIIGKLKTHKFAEPDHEIIFRALTTSKPRTLNSEAALLQSVTRLGFPDIDLSDFFAENQPSEIEIAEILDALNASK